MSPPCHGVRRASARAAAAARCYEASTAGILKWQPYEVVTIVNWCGHQQGVLLVPQGGGFGQIPVLGEAR